MNISSRTLAAARRSKRAAGPLMSMPPLVRSHCQVPVSPVVSPRLKVCCVQAEKAVASSRLMAALYLLFKIGLCGLCCLQ